MKGEELSTLKDLLADDTTFITSSTTILTIYLYDRANSYYGSWVTWASLIVS